MTRIVQYSYHAKVTLSQKHDIHMDMQGPIDPFLKKRGGPLQIPYLIIDPCGRCNHTAPPCTEFTTSLVMWWFIERMTRIRTLRHLRQHRTQRLRIGHLRRARRLLTLLTEALEIAHEDQNKKEIITLYNGYKIYQGRYPLVVTAFNETPRLTNIIQNNIVSPPDIWDGEMSDIPDKLEQIGTDRKWTIARLKRVLRYFKLHGVNVKVTGRRVELVPRVIILLAQHRTMMNNPDFVSLN